MLFDMITIEIFIYTNEAGNSAGANYELNIFCGIRASGRNAVVYFACSILLFRWQIHPICVRTTRILSPMSETNAVNEMQKADIYRKCAVQ